MGDSDIKSAATAAAANSNKKLPEADVLPNQLSHVTNQELTNRRIDLWRSNYHEASIYIEEGLNNDKFENHPRKRASKLVPASNHHQSSNSPQKQHSNISSNNNNNNNNNDGQYQHQQQLQRQPIEGQNIHHEQQTSPLLSCLESKTSPLATTATATTTTTTAQECDVRLDKDNIYVEQREVSRGKGDGDSDGNGGTSRGTFLLGGQYTTIETYILVHNRYFYQLDLGASILLLALALVEPPAIDGYELRPSVHAAIEMFALSIIAIELLLKFRWMGPRRFFSHGRTVAKLLVLLAMNLEALVILFRHSSHARYSRALRPIFLIDNHYCHGMRRAVRQIFQSLPPIIDMFTLALFFMFVFSIFGFYMFAATNHYFADMSVTVGNLLVLATTANLPDVMMPSYAESRWSAIYFVLFIIIHLFLFTNLTMAAVYEIFTRKEKEKFHKLLLHRRKACQKAFKLLVSRRQPDKIQYRQFMGLMRYLNQKCSMFNAYLIFKALDTDQSGSISLEEFYQVYDYINLDWKLIYPEFKWYDNYQWLPSGARAFLRFSERVVKHRFFEWTIDILIAVQAFLQFVEASALGNVTPPVVVTQQQQVFSTTNNMTMALVNATTAAAMMPSPDAYYIKPDKISTYVFISVFTIEMLIMRCLALGWRDYWNSRWNRFDLIVLVVSIGGLISGSVGGHPFGWVIVLRILRLMRVFEFKQRYKDIWQTLTYILARRFISMTCVVMILYYFFAIIGMELFGDYDLRNCCQNTSLEAQFKYDNSTESVRYYLNDFGDLVASYLTLFSMSSSTYWLTTMSAYAYVSGSNWTRVFFALYYLGSIIVMNIVIAFILESFLFHINYRIKMGDNCDQTNLFTVTVTLSSFEVDFLRQNLKSHKETKHLDDIVKKLRRQQQNAGFKDKNSSKEVFFDHQQQQQLDETASLLGHGHGTNGCVVGKGLSKPLKVISQQTKHQHKSSGDKFSEKSSTSLSSASSMAPPPVVAPQVNNVNGKRALNRDDGPELKLVCNCNGLAWEFGHDHELAECCHRRPEWYLIYQAEQIRNKFSFTMKMYADEVDTWLVEADQEDQDEMSRMINRNQIRAEHVAMARLARRNLADLHMGAGGSIDGGDFTRPRSWSTSGGGPAGGNRRRSGGGGGGNAATATGRPKELDLSGGGGDAKQRNK